MFKYIALIVFIFVSLAFYEQYSFSLLTDEQKQTVIDEKKAKQNDKLVKQEKQLLIEQQEKIKTQALIDKPWSEVNKEQYADKFIASKSYFWFLLLLIPTFLFKALDTRNNY